MFCLSLIVRKIRLFNSFSNKKIKNSKNWFAYFYVAGEIRYKFYLYNYIDMKKAGFWACLLISVNFFQLVSL